jgi:enoyl-CoA hydratase
MDYKQLKTTYSDGILVVTISRPEALNALNTLFFDEMDHLLSQYGKEKDLRAIVLTGEGKAFVAGADIAEMVNMNSVEGEAFSMRGQRTFDSIGTFPVPVIAAVNGFALGGGLELAMACDFRVASMKARFGQPEVNLGLIPGYAGTQRLSRLTTLGDALFLLTTAEMIGAEDALRIGLVQKVTEPEALMDETLRIARLIAAKGPKAVRKVKEVTRTGFSLGFAEASALESREFGSLFGNEGTTGMRAFLEKRQPDWNIES